MFIYGDATSQKGDAKLERKGVKENLFTLIKKELMIFNPKFRVPSSNARVDFRRDFLNTIFEKNIFNIELVFDPSCDNAINDFAFCKQDANGGKAVEMVKDPATEQKYNIRGHMSDLTDYIVIQVFSNEFKQFIRPYVKKKSVSIITERRNDKKY